MIKVRCYIFIKYVQEMNEATYYQRNKDVILNRAKKCQENDKEILREQVRINHR